MQITPALRDALGGRLHLLATALEAAGHLTPGRGLSLEGTSLTTSDSAGNAAELSPAAQAFVTGYTPPALPAAPNYGADLMTADEARGEAAQAIASLRTYRGLATPSEAQRKQFENLVARILIYLLRQQFPNL